MSLLCHSLECLKYEKAKVTPVTPVTPRWVKCEYEKT